MAPAPTQLWLASTNPGKLREFSEAARVYGFSAAAVPGIEALPPCVEDGLTFEENARKKAIYYSLGAEGLVFADDSGLCVDRLNGAPGVFSARYAGPDASDEANNSRLISELRRPSLPAAKHTGDEYLSTARYECAIALARRGRVLLTADGTAQGAIIEPPRGSGGFGYDPYFYYPPLGRTFAELSPGAKFAVSHRGHAFRKLLEGVKRLEHADPPSHGGESHVLS